MRAGHLGVALWLLLAAACAGNPAQPAPGRGTLWGTVTLDPREGFEPVRSSSGYGDRRMVHSELVDYTRPGFAVIYLDAPAQAERSRRVHIRDTTVAPRFEPSQVAISAGDELVVVNAGESARTLSCPAASLVRRLDPGESAVVPLAGPGDYRLYLLDVPGAEGTVFAAPGAHTVASDSGHWEIPDLEPGRYRLSTWHPRFPPTSRWVELAPDSTLHVAIELGVEHRDEADDVAH